MTLKRTLRYAWLKFRRLKGDPKKLAWGMALGVFIGVTPTFLFHTVTVLSLAPPQIYSSIFTGRQGVAIEAKRKKLTIFFSDIVGFTSIADVLESEQLTILLNDYLTEMSRIALEHGATIDKFIGDAILAFLGDPESRGAKEDAISCVKMAIAMQRRMREMQASWRGKGLDRAFELRIGITAGFCTVGNFGSEDRMDYTVVGNEVNRAARLQTHAETGGILLSAETYALVQDVIAASDVGPIMLKGIPRPVRALRVRSPVEV